MKFEFTRDCIESGMVIELRNGEKHLVIDKMHIDYNGKKRIKIAISEYFVSNLDSWNKNMLFHDRNRDDLDICKIYEPKLSILKHMLDKDNNMNCIWERKPEVDWSKVPIDTKILVSSDGKKWKNRYFSHYKKDEEKPFYVFQWGCTSWSCDIAGTGNWKYAKLAEEKLQERRRNNCEQ